jgi:hypothetical protein
MCVCVCVRVCVLCECAHVCVCVCTCCANFVCVHACVMVHILGFSCAGHAHDVLWHHLGTPLEGDIQALH